MADPQTPSGLPRYRLEDYATDSLVPDPEGPWVPYEAAEQERSRIAAAVRDLREFETPEPRHVKERAWNRALARVLRLIEGVEPVAPEPWDEADGMCPNCLTPWKCNGPHLSEQSQSAPEQT